MAMALLSTSVRFAAANFRQRRLTASHTGVRGLSLIDRLGLHRFATFSG